MVDHHTPEVFARGLEVLRKLDRPTGGWLQYSVGDSPQNGQWFRSGMRKYPFLTETHPSLDEWHWLHGALSAPAHERGWEVHNTTLNWHVVSSTMRGMAREIYGKGSTPILALIAALESAYPETDHA